MPAEQPQQQSQAAAGKAEAEAERKDDATVPAVFFWEDILKEQAYERIDEQWLQENPWFVRNNVVHETLRNQAGIADYKVFAHPSKREIVTVVHFGEALAGHPGVVHGGIISTIFDNSFGWLYFLQDVGLAFTANLKVDFRKPLYVNSTVYVHVKLHGIERRKLLMEATMETVDHTLHAESSTVFVVARKQPTEENAAAASSEAAPAASTSAGAAVTAST